MYIKNRLAFVKLIPFSLPSSFVRFLEIKNYGNILNFTSHDKLRELIPPDINKKL